MLIAQIQYFQTHLPGAHTSLSLRHILYSELYHNKSSFFPTLAKIATAAIAKANIRNLYVPQDKTIKKKKKTGKHNHYWSNKVNRNVLTNVNDQMNRCVQDVKVLLNRLVPRNPSDIKPAETVLYINCEI